MKGSRLSSLPLFCFLLLLFNPNLFAQSRPEWSKADHAKTIPLRDMPNRVPEKEGHRDKPIHLLVPAAPTGAPDTALQTVATSAPAVGNVTSFDGVGQGAFGFSPNAAPPDRSEEHTSELQSRLH